MRLVTNLRIAAAQDRQYLASLSKHAGGLEAARNELRWLRQHAAKTKGDEAEAEFSTIDDLVERRANGEPLQYIIGDTPFGDLEILCKPKVLIPRPETETYVRNLVTALKKANIFGDRFKRDRRPLAEVLDLPPIGKPVSKISLRVLDICSGTGCISLLLHQLLQAKVFRTGGYIAGEEPTSKKLQILGLDVSPHAVELAQLNLQHNVDSKRLRRVARDEILFRQADATTLATGDARGKAQLQDLIQPNTWEGSKRWDIVISNPPYISPEDYDVGGRTEASVREFEPKLALVPPPPEKTAKRWLHSGDTFYPHIVRIAQHVGTSLLVMEVGDSEQALRVRRMVWTSSQKRNERFCVETWYDDGAMSRHTREQDFSPSQPESPAGSSARAIVVWRGDWAKRRKSTMDFTQATHPALTNDSAEPPETDPPIRKVVSAERENVLTTAIAPQQSAQTSKTQPSQRHAQSTATPSQQPIEAPLTKRFRAIRKDTPRKGLDSKI